ncbi:cobalamin B12-binding domain-containing protein [Roseovarius ramblicola]|uniref:B12-binding domain-containing protein n=1 Tax=Roseovarius ramblicola TaxID=2022336 RepID=A0ABV5I306_9RHOB
MDNLDVAFDSELFTRTASRFVLKRKMFAPDAVEALAGDVLRRLAGTAPGQGALGPLEIRDADIDDFCAALVRPGPEAALRYIEARRAEGVTRMGVYLGYIGAAARRLGEGWERDAYSFLDVTTGTGHLYALMRALRAERLPGAAPFDTRRHALFATVPGEDHSIGITVAADMFRERGWEIDLVTGAGHEALIAHVERSAPRIIGLSLTTSARLDALARLVVAMRLAAPEAIIGVAPTEGLDGDRVVEVVDIDMLFGGAVSACADLERMIDARG